MNRARTWSARIDAVVQEVRHEVVREWHADPRIRHLCVLAIALLVVLIGVLDLHAATRTALRVAAPITRADTPGAVARGALAPSVRSQERDR